MAAGSKFLATRDQQHTAMETWPEVVEPTSQPVETNTPSVLFLQSNRVGRFSPTHPQRKTMFLIRRFNLLISAIANLIQTGLALFYAIQDNTEALKANTASTDKILNTALMCLHIEAVKTQKAVSYL